MIAILPRRSGSRTASFLKQQSAINPTGIQALFLPRLDCRRPRRLSEKWGCLHLGPAVSIRA